MAFLKGADHRRYGTLRMDLANQQNRGKDQYPTDLTGAYSMIANYLGPGQGRQSTGGNHSQQHNNDLIIELNNPPAVPVSIGPHTFTQATGISNNGAPKLSMVPGSDGVTHGNVTCYSCNANGHYASVCPSAISLVQHAYTLAQTSLDKHRYTGISRDWILLDSQSSISIFNNPTMITNIRTSPQPICVRTNGGAQTSNQIGNVKNLGDVWFNTDSIANILSLADVRKVCRVTMDTDV
jgi:hypothetical protein